MINYRALTYQALTCLTWKPEYTFSLCVLSNDMSYYYFINVKGDLSNAKERGLLDINCRKTGTGESLTGLADHGDSQGSTAYYFDV